MDWHFEITCWSCGIWFELYMKWREGQETSVIYCPSCGITMTATGELRKNF